MSQLEAELRRERVRLESELRAAQQQAASAEHRAEVAEKAARDAWSFVKALRGTPRHDDPGDR